MTVTTNGYVEVEQAQRAIERMSVDLAHLRRENRYLRKRLPESTGDMRILRRAYADARTMLVWRFSGFSIGRTSCRKQGLSERRWNWARALLRCARVHNGEDIVEPDFDLAMQAVTACYNRMEASGDAGRLRVYMPRSRQ